MHLPPRPAWRDGERPEALKGERELTAATAAGLDDAFCNIKAENSAVVSSKRKSAGKPLAAKA